MNKSSISNYGWLIITSIVIIGMIGLALVFGGNIGDKMFGTLNTMQDNLDYSMAEPYTVEVLNNISDAGTVSIEGYDDTSVELKGEQTLKLSATANEGYKFLGWYEGDTLISNENPYTYTTSSAAQVTAAYGVLDAGLYDADNNLLASWESLITTYGMDAESSYGPATYNSIASTPYCVLNNSELKNGVLLIVGEECSRIGQYAFYNCSNLTGIILPDTLVSIGQHAFDGCTSLRSITIPSSTTSIELGALQNCTAIESVTYPHNVVFYNLFGSHRNIPTSLKTITMINGDSIRQNEFYNCSSVESINVPDTIVTIGRNAFEGCSSLKNFTMPKAVTAIEQNAFYNCSSITTIDLPETVVNIGAQAFYGCSSLTSIIIPNGATVEGGILCGCTSIKSITIPSAETAKQTTMPALFGSTMNTPQLLETVVVTGGTSIDDFAFYSCASLTSVTLPNTITTIGDSAFNRCTSLSDITIPETVTSIGSNSFYNCSSIKSINLPESILTIGEYAFEGCKSLTTLKMPSSITDIGRRTFYNCASLTSVILPESLLTVGMEAFGGCTMLSSITLPDKLTTIDSFAFYGDTSLENIVIPCSVTIIKQSAFSNCTKLVNIGYNGTVAQWQSITLEDGWHHYNVNYTITCTDGTIAKDGTVTMK